MLKPVKNLAAGQYRKTVVNEKGIGPIRILHHDRGIAFIGAGRVTLSKSVG
jgi:hypothetical protein